MAQKMILHVEDNVYIRDFINQFLSSHGYHVIQAEDGPSGLRLIRQLKPPLVLMDIDLPRMNGLEVMKQIKADTQLNHIPVIACTGSATASDRADFLAAGFVELLQKPMPIAELMRMVNSY
jgi:two-component system cell cycle response regulator DivK